MSISDSSISFTETGPVLPASSDVLAAVWKGWQAAFDNELNEDPATPQGQLVTTQTAIVQDKNAQLAYLASQFDPATSSGRFQDALAAIYFITRQPAQATVVQVTCTGLAGTVIAGADSSDDPAQVKDADGNLFTCQSGGTIPASGSITLPFAAVEAGPLVVPADTVTQIVAAQPGWDTVNNETAGATGSDVESRRAFELRRQQSVMLNSRSMLASIYAEVAQLDGVLMVFARQNRTSAPVVMGGVTLGPHSVYVAVVGGDDNAVAEAMYNSISGGCDYNGNTSVVYTDPVTGAQETVLFERPEAVPISVAVTIAATSTTPSDIVQRIQNNILADFNGQPYTNSDGTAHETDIAALGIGASFYASRFYCPVISAGAANVVSVTIAAGDGPEGNFVELDYDHYPTLSVTDITVDVQGATA